LNAQARDNLSNCLSAIPAQKIVLLVPQSLPVQNVWRIIIVYSQALVISVHRTVVSKQAQLMAREPALTAKQIAKLVRAKPNVRGVYQTIIFLTVAAQLAQIRGR
jgi:hypothetical protein